MLAIFVFHKGIAGPLSFYAQCILMALTSGGHGSGFQLVGYSYKVFLYIVSPL